MGFLGIRFGAGTKQAPAAESWHAFMSKLEINRLSGETFHDRLGSARQLLSERHNIPVAKIQSQLLGSSVKFTRLPIIIGLVAVAGLVLSKFKTEA